MSGKMHPVLGHVSYPAMIEFTCPGCGTDNTRTILARGGWSDSGGCALEACPLAFSLIYSPAHDLILKMSNRSDESPEGL